MYHILLSAALSFLITFFAIPVIIQVAKDKKLFDEPDERKVHKTVIPTLGGIGIFAGFIIATLMGVPSGIASELQYFVDMTGFSTSTCLNNVLNLNLLSRHTHA